MEVGGYEYKKLKNEVDEITRRVYETERQLNRNKTTVESSESSLRRID